MLFFIGVIKRECEFEKALGLDDVVIRYMEKGIWIYRILQAKHKSNDKVRVSDLRSIQSDNDFSLLKLFVSFSAIMNTDIFQTQENIKDVIIITNTDFQFKINIELDEDVEDENETDLDESHEESENQELLDEEQWISFFKQEPDNNDEFLCKIKVSILKLNKKKVIVRELKKLINKKLANFEKEQENVVSTTALKILNLILQQSKNISNILNIFGKIDDCSKELYNDLIGLIQVIQSSIK